MKSDSSLVPSQPICPTNEFVAWERSDVEQSIPQRFEWHARKYPDHVAIHSKHRSTSYSELNRAANQIARAVIARNKDGKNAVGVLLEKDAPMIAAMLGVLKAAQVYVPLDTGHPVTRLSQILDDAETELIVTNNRFLSLAKQLAGDAGQILNTDEDLSDTPGEDLGLAISPHAPCYIIYTSGSTGEPKGVIQNHRNTLHTILRHSNGLHLCDHDRYAVLASCATAQGVPGIYGALLNGGALYLYDVKEEGFTWMARWLSENEITVYHSSASVFRNFCECLSGNEDFSKLRFIKIGSEPVSKRDVELYQKYFPANCILVDTLASTEAGPVLQSMMDKNTVIQGNFVPVGFPLDDMQIRLLNEAGNEVGVEAVGEICIESDYLSPGYWRRPEQTNRAFTVGTTAEGRRVYRSGDLGRMDRDGSFICIGRKDSRLKISGFAVEVAEVEAALRNLSDVMEAAVVAQEIGTDQRMIAYVAPRHGLELGPSALRKQLSENLPDYMIPSIFVMLEVMPRTVGGKLDRSALPAPQASRPALDTPLVLSRTQFERDIAALWTDVLRLAPVGVNDDFFELGGTSLKAAQILSRVQRAYGVDVSMRSFFEGPTVAGLAQAVVQKKAEGLEQASGSSLLRDVLRRFQIRVTGS